MSLMQISKHPPQLKVVPAITKDKRDGAGQNNGTVPSGTYILAAILSSLLIPGIAVLDVLLFTITRPSCGGCANMGVYFTDHSMTMAFIQGNKAIQNSLVIFRKLI